MPYFIRKASRMGGPYTGPACERVGIPEGRWYDTRLEAEADAVLLTSVNPVGFHVLSKEEWAAEERDNDEDPWPVVKPEIERTPGAGDNSYVLHRVGVALGEVFRPDAYNALALVHLWTGGSWSDSQSFSTIDECEEWLLAMHPW